VVQFVRWNAEANAPMHDVQANQSYCHAVHDVSIQAILSVQCHATTANGPPQRPPRVHMTLDTIVDFAFTTMQSRVENTPPYLLFGNTGPKVYGEDLPVGVYQISATPLTNVPSNSYSVRFSIVACPGAQGVRKTAVV
jgi:hypothetical protein